MFELEDKHKKYLYYALLLVFLVIFIDGFLRMLSGNPVMDRKEYWKEKIATELPTGSTWDDITVWGELNTVNFEKDSQNTLRGTAEIIPDPGLEFPCSQWNIVIIIDLDASGRSTDQKIKTIGSCL